MTKDQANAIVAAAAERWANEIEEYIIPDGRMGDGEAAEWQSQANDIYAALRVLEVSA